MQKAVAMASRLPVEVLEFVLDIAPDGDCAVSGGLIRWLCSRVPLLTINRAMDGSGHWVVGLGRNGPVRWAASLAEALVLMVEEVERQEKAKEDDNAKQADAGGA